MFYNRILRVWVIDPLDYFLLIAILGSIAASRLKEYLSEKKAMERLKSSIIKKSELVRQSNRSNSKKLKIQKIYRLTLGNRGGQFEEFQMDHKFSDKAFKLAQQIKEFVERLAVSLKERELKGVARIFFKNGKLLLELILYRYRIDITYAVLAEGLSTQVIVITATAGGAAGFIFSWFSAGASLVAPPLLFSTFLIRSVAQQIINHKDYSEFKAMVNKMLEDDDKLKKTIRAFFLEEEVPTSTLIEMKPWDSGKKNPLPELHFDSDQTFEEFIKARMKEEFGLVENPTPEQVEQMIKRPRRINKPKGKTVYFRDFINQIAENSDDIIDAEIITEAIKVKVKNEEL